MNKLNTSFIMIVSCLVFCAGCRDQQMFSSFDNNVFADLELSQSEEGSGTRFEYKRNSREVVGYDYGEDLRWLAEVSLDFADSSRDYEEYHFNGIFPLAKRSIQPFAYPGIWFQFENQEGINGSHGAWKTIPDESGLIALPGNFKQTTITFKASLLSKSDGFSRSRIRFETPKGVTLTEPDAAFNQLQMP
ncbi:MAG TPA: hypothetical protein VJ952_05535 [Opitutales bacterium]|nr:hypothetical protein [Opitutales bacterium]